MRALVCLVSVLAITAAASGAGLLVNGDFSMGETGWTQWRAGWGSTEVWDATSGVGILGGGGGNGSFGWFQAVEVPVGTPVTLDASWTGDIGGVGWTEVMLYTSADAGTNWGGLADAGAAGNIAFKKASDGINPPYAWNWEPASLSPLGGGNGGSIVSQGYVCVATKLGGFPLGYVNFDNIVLTPEPATALLLGLALPLIRRRRA